MFIFTKQQEMQMYIRIIQMFSEAHTQEMKLKMQESHQTAAATLKI